MPEANSRSNDDDDDAESRTGATKKGKFEYKQPKLNPLPKEHWECKTWLHKLITRVEQASSRTDQSERQYLLKVLEVTDATDPWLYSVPENMTGMDRVLLPELTKLCEKDKTLHREVEMETLTCINSGKRLTSVMVLHLIVCNLATDKAMLVEVTSADLLAIQWKGEEKATEFYQEWIAVESRIEADTMSSRARMNMLWTQLRQSEKVAFAVHKWSDKPTAERTYEELLERFRAWLVEQRSYQNYLKATRRTNSDKPNIAGMQSDVGEKQAKKGKNKKKNKNDGCGDASDVAAVVNKSGNTSIASRRQDGSKPKTKCLNFQEEYGMKGCTRKPKCPYLLLKKI